MKRIFDIAAVFSAVVLMSGCTDWLMIQPRGVEVPSKVEHYEGLLYGTELFTIGEVFPYMCFENTCTKDGFETMYSVAGQPETRAYCWEANIFREDENCTEWNFPAENFYRLNVVVNGVMDAEDGTEEEKLAVYSEARMMRAYMHFLMAQFFGKPYDEATAGNDLCVPVITEASTTQTDLPRRSVADVYSFILTEMEESVPHLPERASHYCRVFKAAGYAMLGKVNWMMGRYSEAAVALSEAVSLLEASGTGIFLDYNSMVSDGKITFPTDSKQIPEHIYNIESMFLLYHAMWPVYYGSTMLYLKPEVLSLYYTDTDDLRLTFICGMNSGRSPYGRSFDMSEQYYFEINRLITNIGITTPDIYLMYAESLARTGEDTGAVDAVEKLRAARMPDWAVPAGSSTGDELIKFVVAERMRENLGYGLSWFDMRRLWNDPLFQDMKSMYVHSDGTTEHVLTEQRLVMRIPPQILSWHPEYLDNE